MPSCTSSPVPSTVLTIIPAIATLFSHVFTSLYCYPRA
jgi:hypothetical protein